MTDFQFVIEPAETTQLKLKMALYGPSGSGKTFTSLTIAKELGRILLIETEGNRSLEHADSFQFSRLPMPEYSLDCYIAALDYAATQDDFDVVIIDSLTHAWSGSGGALEQAEKAKGKFGGNKFAGWSVVTPLQNKLIDRITKFPKNLIVTMRSKTEYVEEEKNGKKKYVPVGLAPVQRGGIEYEFSITAMMNIEHTLDIVKTTLKDLDGVSFDKPGAELGQIIKMWLETGSKEKLWPGGWYPTKRQFFDKAIEEFKFDVISAANILKSNGFDSGWDVSKVVGMWNALEAEYYKLKTEFSERESQKFLDDEAIDKNQIEHTDLLKNDNS